MAEVTYYFNGVTYLPYLCVQFWSTPASRLVDNNLSTFQQTATKNCRTNPQINTCPGTNLGTITKVEMRSYGYGDGGDKCLIISKFGATEGDSHDTTPASSASWGSYVDVTNDANAPSPWSWSDIQSLDAILEYVGVAKANIMYMAKVEIRVTYTPSGPSYYHGLKVQGVGELALCDVGTHPLRIRKGGTTYGIELVATDDPNASALRIKTGAGIKAIRKYT